MKPSNQTDPRERKVVLALKREREAQEISATKLAMLLKIADGLGVRLKDLMD